MGENANLAAFFFYHIPLFLSSIHELIQIEFIIEHFPGSLRHPAEDGRRRSVPRAGSPRSSLPLSHQTQRVPEGSGVFIFQKKNHVEFKETISKPILRNTLTQNSNFSRFIEFKI